MIVLLWDSHGCREGWWIKTGDRWTAAVIGPSICISSGGGPKSALERARELYPDIKIEKIHAPYAHYTYPDHKPCIDCNLEAHRLNEQPS